MNVFLFRFLPLLLISAQFAHASLKNSEDIIIDTKRLYLPEEFPGAHNPSIVEYGDGYLLCFRHTPKKYFEHWISYIGIAELDANFELVSGPQLLDTRVVSQETPSQSEDARIFSVNGKFYVVYNDNIEFVQPYSWERRDMYLAEVLYDGKQFTLDTPLKLTHENMGKHRDSPWQKNWTPFDWENELMLLYEINPLEVLHPNLKTGKGHVVSSTKKEIKWSFGGLRGGSPALLVDGEYLAFFHSAEYMKSPSSDDMELWHYFMGAYTFSASPPFELTSMSADPLNSPSFYTYSSYYKRVIYPGGFVVRGPTLFLSYGKDDCELWIATIDLQALYNSMKPVTNITK
jgi:predicted GH43/DUF377 family glycosyl hydrolase